ncbi:MAG: BON domain-containing protein [Acidobacteriaceae bacterium]|nr:BON domain-containing protein [Acidobacteriaceae bacterium]
MTIRVSMERMALTVALSAVALTAGCKKTIDDATLANNVKQALAGDPSIAQQPLQETVVNGVVTLTGTATDDTARSVAAQDAARVAGVKEVVNNIALPGAAPTPTITTPEAPASPRPATESEKKSIAANKPLPPPPAAQQKPATPPPPPAPVVRNITAPAGTPLSIRITETLSSKDTQAGTPFNGVLNSPVVVSGITVLPSGSPVSGTVVDAKDAGHFKGNSLLAIQLTAVRRKGQLLPISTDVYSVEGKGRGKNSALKIGGGAAAGALLGGLIGGGKGAGIGALAGGGGGAAYQGFTRGEQVEIPSESALRFRLSAPITIQTTETPSADTATPSTGLQTR